MSHNDALDYTQRLYARVPSHYRAYDAEQGLPLLALLRVVGEQVANVRQDMDALWDNFFIETCDEWAVPYIGALLGANLLAQDIGQSNRLDVWNTVLWRRSKGTPAMLRALANAITGWPVDLAEFFQTLGWSQNMNHLRLDHPQTPDLRDGYRLSLLGHAADPFAHAADFKPARPLDQARITPTTLGIGRAGWGTPGRYGIKNLGFFVRRLQTFPRLKGVTPAAAAPGLPAPANAACFTFDPLFAETPLFVEATGEPLTRAAFGWAPWATFGTDLGVRQFGVLLASDVQPMPDLSSSQTAFTFDAAGAGLTLDATLGLRLLDPRAFAPGAAHFVITAGWLEGSTTTPLGTLSTLHAVLGGGTAFKAGTPAAGAGQLVLTVQTGRAGLGWPGMPPAPAARFPGAVLAVRAARAGAPHLADSLYVYLPPAFVQPADAPTYYVATDGSTYSTATFGPDTLARAAEGQVYPPRPLSMSTVPADGFTVLSRGPGGLRLPDPSRFGGVAMLVEAHLFTGTFQEIGAICTIDQTQAGHPELVVPDPWPAFTYGLSVAAANDTLPSEGLLSIHLAPLSGNTFLPQSELIVANRTGRSLLVYLPEQSGVGADGVWLFVADDGSTYVAPPDNAGQLAVFRQHSLEGLQLGRASAGHVIPIAGTSPIQQRRPVAINLCRCERNSLLHPGELGIDPELGRFALAPGDPAIAQGGFSVDYVEAFSDRVGARTYDRQLNPKIVPTRLVAQSGDAASAQNPAIARDHIYPDLGSALAAAEDADVIEIADSATYTAPAEILFNRPGVQMLTVRAAAGQRPCLAFYAADGTATAHSLHIAPALTMSSLELNGLLISGGPLLIESPIARLQLIACTLDPRGTTTPGSVIVTDANPAHHASYLLCRCISGGLRLAAGVDQLTVADSIVDAYGGLAIGGVPMAAAGGATIETAAQATQLERVTVLGRLHCVVLSASESLLDDRAQVEDQQAGCIRFSRYEPGSVLPRRYQCVPSEAQAASCAGHARCLAPLFNSRRFGRPDYVQLAAACPAPILTASEAGAEVGAFAGALNAIRLSNLDSKLREFLPVSLSALVIAET